MMIFSGECCFCEVGIDTGELDMHGNALYTGDIVQLWHGNYIGTDIECWYPTIGITAIVANKYQTYRNLNSGGFEHRLIDESAKPFTMGIKDDGVQGGEWRVSLVKSHKDIIEGERIPSFGINYKTLPAKN